MKLYILHSDLTDTPMNRMIEQESGNNIDFSVEGSKLYLESKQNSTPKWTAHMQIHKSQVPFLKKCNEMFATVMYPFLTINNPHPPTQFEVPYSKNPEDAPLPFCISVSRQNLTSEDIQIDHLSQVTALVTWPSLVQVCDKKELIADINDRIDPKYPRILTENKVSTGYPHGTVHPSTLLYRTLICGRTHQKMMYIAKGTWYYKMLTSLPKQWIPHHIPGVLHPPHWWGLYRNVQHKRSNSSYGRYFD